MALTLGINCGFVTTAPTADPDGFTGSSLENLCIVQRHTLPPGSWKITEIGFWQDKTDNYQGDFNVGIYSHNSGTDKPDALVTTQSSGLHVPASTPGWAKYTSLEISLSGGTYWIAGGFDSVVYLQTNYSPVSGERCGLDTISGPTISNPWSSTGEVLLDNYIWAIYALYEASSSGPSIPILMSYYAQQ